MRTFPIVFPALSFVFLSLGCVAEPVAMEDESAASADDELSAVSQSFVVIRRDFRRCMSPICGGFWVRDANRPYGKEVYVSGLDLSLSRLSETDAAKVTDAPSEELVLRGKLGAIEKVHSTRPFMITEAYRGMPGVTVKGGDLFYRAHDRDPKIVCKTAPCNNEVGTKLNFRPEFDFTRLAVDAAAKPLVDKAWLSREVLARGAIVAASIHDGAKFPGGFESVLDASQVFVRIPNNAGPCPMFKIAKCPEPTVNTWGRTADRCQVPTGCAMPRACAKVMPICEEGYTLSSLTSQPSACPAYTCDPSFL